MGNEGFMNIHTIARRAATQMHDDQFDLVTRKAATEFKQDKPFRVFLGWVVYMLAAIVMMAIAQKVWGV